MRKPPQALSGLDRTRSQVLEPAKLGLLSSDLSTGIGEFGHKLLVARPARMGFRLGDVSGLGITDGGRDGTISPPGPAIR